MNAVALMYHDVVEPDADDTSGFPGRDAALYKVTPQLFEAHIRSIVSSTGASGVPVLTFDDGGVSAMRAADLLERCGLRGHFFVTANYIGTPGFLDRRQLCELHVRGHVIGSHSCSHPLRMGHCSWARLEEEWAGSRDLLSAILGQAIEVASVPGGDFAPPVARAASAAGFRELFTSEPTSRVMESFGLRLRGRYTIQRWTSAATAAALARAEWRACASQALVWNAKKLGKRVGGHRYLQLRRLLLGHGDDVAWGDRDSSTERPATHGRMPAAARNRPARGRAPR
jgi:peptidoglycan/xylan/chitin deacetylase (PgdA/CDA1 family)